MNENQFILELIGVYRNLPALWCVKSKEYNNRLEKYEQYKILLKKYRERYPNAEKKDLTKRINSLRTGYRKELKRMQQLEKYAVGKDLMPQSNLFYFYAMDFLRDNLQPSTTQTTVHIKSEVQNPKLPMKRKKLEDDTDVSIVLAEERVQQPPDDDCEKIVESWSVKFRKMNATQRIYADKFINEILFEGQMGTLHRDSMVLNVAGPSYTDDEKPFIVL